MQGTEPQPSTDTESTERDCPGRQRSGGPFGGLTPEEASRRGVEARREKSAERAAEAELDKLTVHGRVSTALAREMSYAEIASVIRTLRATATDAKAGLRVQAARELREWLKLAGLDPGEEPEDVVSLEDMAPQQRAATRARVLREITALEEPIQVSGVTNELPSPSHDA
ncbi:MAG: hypothetical protein M3R70_04135 [Actinomycetota bacterium]|nr:hypothetical protein [Actinomycetota bacterium]